jgi:hypothetical protein
MTYEVHGAILLFALLVPCYYTDFVIVIKSQFFKFFTLLNRVLI